VAGNPTRYYNLAAGAHTLVVAYREDGAKIDRLLITNDNNYVPMGMGPLLPPALPTGVMAAPGNAQVTVSWAASGGATTYTLKRGASGGPYMDVAMGITGTSRVDGGLTNG